MGREVFIIRRFGGSDIVGNIWHKNGILIINEVRQHYIPQKIYASDASIVVV